MRQMVLLTAAFFAVALSPLLVLAAPQVLRPGEPVLVISAPWSLDAATVISKTGLHEISPERAPLGALTVLAKAGDEERLRQNGAWFVIDGTVIARLCADE